MWFSKGSRLSRPQVLSKALVAACTPNAMMMPAVSNPSRAITIAMTLDALLVGRKSP
jgi:hypothetical protein